MTTALHPKCHPQRRRCALAASIVWLLAAQAARADLSWDNIFNNWSATGAANTVWDSTRAIFGGTAELVTINSSVSATGLTS